MALRVQGLNCNALATIQTMKNLFVAFLFLFFTQAKGQTFSSIICDSTIINFLKWDLLHDRIYAPQDTNRTYFFCNEPLPWDSSEIMLNKTNIDRTKWVMYGFNNLFLELRKKNITELTEGDRIFIENQFCALTKCKSVKVIDKSIKLRRCKRTSSLKHIIQYFSIPLFSIDNSVVVIKRSSRGLKSFLSCSVLVYKKTSVNNYKLVYWETVYPDTL
jgi:hypothetical protein